MLSEHAKKLFFNNNFVGQSVYLGLIDDTNSEVSAAEYERKSISWNNPSTSGNKVSITNDNKVEFDTAESDWGAIEKMAIFDSASGGNKLDEATLSSSVDVKTNYQFWIDSGGYKIELE